MESTSPSRRRESPEDRFWRHVFPAGALDCWAWRGSCTRGGYGQFMLGRRSITAHRWAYEQMVGPIPEGLSLDHLCKNRACVNPYHLDPVTQRVNVLRGDHPNIVTHISGVCKRGHSMADALLSVRPDGSTQRKCRPCSDERERARGKRRTEARRRAS